MAIIKKTKTTISSNGKLKAPVLSSKISMPPSKAKKRGNGDGYMAMISPKLKLKSK